MTAAAITRRGTVLCCTYSDGGPLIHPGGDTLFERVLGRQDRTPTFGWPGGLRSPTSPAWPSGWRVGIIWAGEVVLISGPVWASVSPTVHSLTSRTGDPAAYKMRLNATAYRVKPEDGRRGDECFGGTTPEARDNKSVRAACCGARLPCPNTHFRTLLAMHYPPALHE